MTTTPPAERDWSRDFDHTDPAYADKLARTINTTLRLQRAMS